MPRQRIAITGASGLIGGALSAFLRARGDEVIPLVRRPATAGELQWHPHAPLSPTALDGVDAVVHLAGAGVGTLWLADGDTLDSSNLPRQILFDGEGLRCSKAELARERLAAHNPHVELIAINQRLDGTSLPGFVAEVDLVVDCCDNLASRHAINAACVEQGKPWISAAAVGWQGQLMVRSAPEHACYACLYPADTAVRESCQSSGVTGPLVGVMGSLQALEALKLLLGRPSPVAGTLRRFDALTHEWQALRLPADPDCPVCGRTNPALKD